VLAPVSISESRPNPASATDRAVTAATASTAIPATFQPSVMPSRIRPRRSSMASRPVIARTGSSIATRPAWQLRRGQANMSRRTARQSSSLDFPANQLRRDGIHQAGWPSWPGLWHVLSAEVMAVAWKASDPARKWGQRW
jgi:hypothetical protein